MGGLRSMSKLAALCAVLAALAACTQVDKAAAIKLADAGKVAATNGAAEAAAARIDFVAGGERGAAAILLADVKDFESATQNDFAPPNQTINKARMEIAAILKLREDALMSLAATYGEMARLAAGDTGADIRKAAADLVGKTNGLAIAVNAATGGAVPLIANTVGAAFAEAAALYAEERQRREILTANELVAKAVEQLRTAIEAESQYVGSSRLDSQKARAELARLALNLGMVDQSAAILRIAELAGFQAIKDPGALLIDASSAKGATEDQMRRQRLVWALAGFEAFRAESKASAIKDASESLASALANLTDGHKKLAKRESFNADAALALALKVKEAVERIRDAAK
jgi:hypothetical protein